MSRVPPAESSQRPSSWPFLAAAAALLALSIAVQVVRDRGWQPYQPATPMLWFQSGPLLKRVALGFDNIIADIYWIRAVVYYGGSRRADDANRNFDLLAPLLNFVTDLDPRFRVAYRFGAIFLTEAHPQGPGRPDAAIALLEKGLRANPNGWEYMQDIGFVHYWWLHDFKSAALWFQKAGQLPGAPAWLPALAANTLAQGGDRQSSRFLWRQLLETSDVEYLQQNAQRRLTQLDAMDVIDALNRLSESFRSREGRPPRAWSELATADRLPGVPLDPTGVPYELDPATGVIALSRQSLLWPLPVDQSGDQTATPP